MLVRSYYQYELGSQCTIVTVEYIFVYTVQERDPDGDEKLSYEQLRDIFRIYEVESSSD